MPEIKNQFTKGKMNKDLDERLVPNGEYRDAMNIQVATSEGSDVGTAQNILGNKIINVQTKNGDFDFGPDAVAVGTIADEKLDTLYWLIWTPTVDYICSYVRDNAAGPEFIFVDKKDEFPYGGILNFDPDNIITGINVIDNILLFTDNVNEPKKINIDRCKQGTDQSGTIHTKLINESFQNTAIPTGQITVLPNIEEKHVTVIKKAPAKALTAKLNTIRKDDEVYTGVVEVTLPTPVNTSSFFVQNTATGNVIQNQLGIYNFGVIDLENGVDTFYLTLKGGVTQTGSFIPGLTVNDLNGWGSLPYTGTKVVLKAFDSTNDPPSLPITDYDLKGVIESAYGTSSSNSLKIKITSAVNNPPLPQTTTGSLQYAVDLFQEDDKLFEFKFPRFSYRYKYEDGEYSPFAPFTQVAFEPGAFDYHPRKGYNLGMTNRLESIDLSGFIYKEMPEDIVAVDILFKDEPSPAVYVVDTIRPDDQPPAPASPTDPPLDNTWFRLYKNESFDPSAGQFQHESYRITKETVNNILPSNQLLRPWDNVPRRALAQDVVGNRVVYGNYVQNYTLLTASGDKYFPDFKGGFRHFDPSEDITGVIPSCKTLREYQLGVVFIDKYGRETPVLSNPTGTFKLEKEHAKDGNKILIGLKGQAENHMPVDMTYMKFFVKETSNEYYNLAMDRWYDAEDGNIWLAFASSDRNKVDIDTFLILKKGSDSDDQVFEKARYKILAIEAEAPEYIKTSKLLYSQRKNVYTVDPSTQALQDSIFSPNTTDDVPLVGREDFKLKYSEYDNTPGSDLHLYTEGELWIEFSEAAGNQVSDRYRISSITLDDPGTFYSIRLDRPLEDDVNFICDSPTGLNATGINTNINVNIYQYKPENLPQFDGRFFVKIYKDEVFTQNIQKTLIGDTEFRILDSRPVYYLQQDYIEKFTDTMGDWWTPTRYLNGARGTKIYPSYPYSFGDKKGPNGNPDTGGWFVQNFSGHRVFGGLEYISGQLTSVIRWTSTRTISGLTQINIDSGINHYGFFHNHKFTAPAIWFNRYLPNKNDRYAEHELWRAAVWNGNSGDDRDDASKWLGQNKQQRDNMTSGFNRGGLDFALPFNPPERPNVNYRRVDYDVQVARDAEVWFIDHGVVRGRRWDNVGGLNTHPPSWGSDEGDRRIRTSPVGVDEYDPSTMYGDTTFGPIGLVKSGDKWNMELGFGGIGGGDFQGGKQIDSFYNIGEWTEADPANSDYNDSATRKWVGKLKPGTTFRWLNDPYNTVYTFGANIKYNNYIRHSSHCGNTKGGETFRQGNRFADQMAGQINFNHTKAWRFRDITPKLKWDPTILGEIPNGLKMSLTICDINGGTTAITTQGDASGPDGNDVKIYVTSISPTNSNTNFPTTNPPLHVGMALKKFDIISDNNVGDFGHVVANESGAIYGDGEGRCSRRNDYYVVRKITPKNNGEFFELVLGGYDFPMQEIDHAWLHSAQNEINKVCPKNGGLYNFVQVGMNGQSPNSAFNINENGYYLTSSEYKSVQNFVTDTAKDHRGVNTNTVDEVSGLLGKIGAVGYEMQFIDEVKPTEVISENPAVWETEPKESKDLDIYYEATGAIPYAFDHTTIEDAFPIGSIISDNGGVLPDTTVTQHIKSPAQPRLVINPAPISPSYQQNVTQLGNSIYTVTTPDGLKFGIEILAGQNPAGGFYQTSGNQIVIDKFLYNANFELNWHNCFSFGNGVESNRVRDSFNLPFIVNGVKVSTTLETEYKEENRKYGLIYSGIYNSNSGVNDLNQFIQAEKITKDVNPIYGSIQKLHTRDSDLLTLCEDKCLRILAQKDALFNADGNTNLTATENVLGQTIPFSGEFGISTNPESFASENYRVYFTDKIRGVVLRLSKDGLTPISEYGMKDWFRDNLKLVNNNDKIIGGYDDRDDEYNVKLEIKDKNQIDDSKIVTYSEKVKGWVSFKSYTDMQLNTSMANDYYTFYKGNLYKHYDEDVDRNTFYGEFTPSSLEVVLNKNADIIKHFNTINYEGSQCKIEQFQQTVVNVDFQPQTTYTNQQIYNLTAKEGWYVENIFTDKEEGNIKEFIEKEGKWFNNINRKINITGSVDSSDFTFQGIGIVNDVDQTGAGPQSCPVVEMFQATINDDLTFVIPPADPNAPLGSYISYDWILTTPSPNVVNNTTGSTGSIPSVTIAQLLAAGDNATWNLSVNFYWETTQCTSVATFTPVLGCTSPNAPNYDSSANINDGSCRVGDDGGTGTGDDTGTDTGTGIDPIDFTVDTFGDVVSVNPKPKIQDTTEEEKIETKQETTPEPEVKQDRILSTKDIKEILDTKATPADRSSSSSSSSRRSGGSSGSSY